ncbi:MAG: DNA repair protein RadC [Rhodocyclaceae bacterium]|nr:DNA repair protein RadC [Rhodocyclaceae bacterium]MCA3025094.1 DNA repair protein RadC [Rhodocyclaceae bacterium]MCA3032456.1 DNA repair protein RadC [Rhodocyclaceae bacterium]MCA3036785.1 DNA repair protein RadC [Rhodocyclaceae bacterium]MCA3045129.1 DNA repair protein RadC [Rhodocyclaceae bacterium]
MSITNWPEAERPRERLIAKGAAALSDAELLAIFLRVGTKGKSAVDLARELVRKFGSLHGLFSASQDQLTAVNGIGEAKFVQLQAVLEMAKRALHEEIKLADALSNPRAVRDYLRMTLARLPHEVFVAVFLTAQNRVIAVDELFRGTLTQTSVYPREIVKRALAHNAASVILAHNHPSGEATPSQADRSLTKTLAEALSVIDVRVLDHFIVAPGASLSFAEQGLWSA